ncbi:MAG: 1-acyl-sn-glycerol-3-phosphate acyltransferase [Gemmatimonadaceae bacterium]|nr:1-acyl-sn-glycerol-3-phosphate acyltransferase [Gemmatimonadaceae bacterium]
MTVATAGPFPSTGPVLLIGNHPNDLPDVLAGLEVSGRHLRYVATISATTLPLASATYRGMGVIPVMRVRDVRKMRALGIDVGAVNAAAFGVVGQALRDGEVVGVFPEGGVHDTSAVGRPRSGVAKMALQYIDAGSENELHIVPFGMHYDAPRTFRSDLTIQVGVPLGLKAWHARLAGSTPQSAIEGALNDRLHEMLLGVTRNSSSWDKADARDRLVAVIAAIGAELGGTLSGTALACQHRCAELMEEERAAEWQAMVDPISAAVGKVGGIASSPRDVARVLDAAGMSHRGAAWPSLLAMAASAPIALVGLVIHAPLWWAVRAVARHMTAVRTDYVAKAILPGLHLILLGYLGWVGLFVIVATMTDVRWWWVVPLVIALPRLGDAAMWWRDAVRAHALRARVRGWHAADRRTLHDAVSRLSASWLHVSP